MSLMYSPLHPRCSAPWETHCLCARGVEVELTLPRQSPGLRQATCVRRQFPRQPSPCADFLAIASQRFRPSPSAGRRLVNPDLPRGCLPSSPRDPGLSSGHIMVQITAASLCGIPDPRVPASIGTLPTTRTREFRPDGNGRGVKARRIWPRRVRLGADFLSRPGNRFSPPARAGRGVEALHRRIR